MSDKKISELTALASADIANDDELVIVDTSAGETKKTDASSFASQQTTTNIMSKGTVYRFDGASYVNVGDVSDLDFGTGSFFIHTKIKVDEGFAGIQNIVSKGGYGSTGGYTLAFDSSERLTFFVEIADGTAYEATGSAVFSSTDYVDIMAVRDTTSATGLKIYVNGVEISYGTQDDASGVDVASSGKNFVIGCETGLSARFFTGENAMVCVGNFAPTASEIKDLISGNLPYKWQYGSQTDKVTNGTFDADTDWTKGGSWTIAAGVASYSDAGDSSLTQANVLTLGKTHSLTFEIKSATATMAIGDGVGELVPPASYAVGTHTVSIENPSGTTLSFQAKSAGVAFDLDNVSVIQLGAVAHYTQDSISETYWYDKANGNDGAVTGAEVLNKPSVTPLLAMHTNTIRLQVGATPGTNINCVNVDVSTWNPASFTDATNLAKGGTSGSFALSADGQTVTLTLDKDVVGILGYGIRIHDLNSSSTTEMYLPSANIVAGAITIGLIKRASTGFSDLTTILDAGDICHVWVSYVTAT